MKNVKITVNGVCRFVPMGTCVAKLLSMETPCGGHGKCGKCKVRATGALSPIGSSERAHLSDAELATGIRLACCTLVEGECFIEALLPQVEQEEILLGGVTETKAVAPIFERLGIAIDIGTTTVAAKLLSPSGEVLSEYGIGNPQASFGADVISRIEAALGGEAEALASAIRKGLDDVIRALCRSALRSAQEVDGVVITGNTVMLSLLTGTTVEPLSHAPFAMERGFGEWLQASELSLTSLLPNTKIYLPPCIAAFIGADTVCALLASGLYGKQGHALLVDIGTNGEMALLKDGKLTVCSTAAGPALEGVGISMGMRAATGAIDRVTLQNGALAARVIGGGEPAGICGSGLVDAIAMLLEVELLDETGFLEDDEVELLSPVSLSQKDIRMVQLAKSAICAGLCTLMHTAGLQASDISRFLIAGGFGTYLDRINAGRIGLLPEDLISVSDTIGNAALSGAALLLLDDSLRATAEQIAAHAEVIDLSSNPYFSDAYLSGMLFPSKS